MPSILIIGGSSESQDQILEDYLSPLDIHTHDRYTVAGATAGIEEIRDLKRWLITKPFASKHRAVIIRNAGKLTIEAQNALLKTLEEPPSGVYMLLLVDRLEAVLPTIQSRCRLVYDPQLLQTNTQSNLVESLLVSSPAERLILASHVAQTRDAAERWVLGMIGELQVALRGALKANKKPELESIFFALRRCLHLVDDISTNANVRLCVEACLFDLPGEKIAPGR